MRPATRAEVCQFARSEAAEHHRMDGDDAIERGGAAADFAGSKPRTAASS